MTLRLLAALAVAALLGTGCGTTYKVALEYYPSGDAKALPNSPEVWLAQPADVRGNTREIGQERSSLGKRKASVKSKEPVVNWVGNSLLLELERSGYTVQRCRRDLARGWKQPEIMLVIPGLQRCYADTTVSAKSAILGAVGKFMDKSSREIVANIDLSLDVYYRDQRYRKVYRAACTKNRGRDSNPADIYKACYEEAMADIARQVAHDVQALVASPPGG